MLQVFDNFNSGFNSSGLTYGTPDYNRMAGIASSEEDDVSKALVTGNNIVAAGDTGGRALRLQFLHDVLETASFEQDDAKLMKLIPIEKVYSTAFEWSQYLQYGGPGNGFVSETGSDGLFGLTATDDNFVRQVQNLKFLAAYRTVSLAAQLVKGIEDPETAAQKGATNEIIGKANIAGYFGDSASCNVEWNGLMRQILDWCDAHPEDSGILYDAAGEPLDESILEDVLTVGRQVYGNQSLLIMGSSEYGDTQTLLFPKSRFDMGSVGMAGGDKRSFQGPYGKLRLEDDPMLRAGRPLVTQGTGLTGAPRSSTTADSGSPSFATTPWTTAPTSIAPGTGNFWAVATKNTDASALATAPQLPSGSGNNSNRLSAGNYYYAVSAVTNGLEGPAWVYGSTVAGDPDTPTVLAIVDGNIAKIVVQFSVLSGTPVRAQTKFRIYRYGGPNVTAAPTSLSQFSYLMETATPTTGNPTNCYDNGFLMPNTNSAFCITEKKQASKGWFMAQLLPLMRRTGLPAMPMGDPIAMLWFATPILLIPRHHIWIRNIGRLKR